MSSIKEHKFHYPKSGETVNGEHMSSGIDAPCGLCDKEICRHYDEDSGYSCRLLVHSKGDHANDLGSWKRVA